MSKKSGPAIFMYTVIAIAITVAAVCLVLYYCNILPYDAVLWTGVVTFTLTYHFWLRLIMGSITRRLHIHHGQWWFKERKFEKKLYKLLRVRKWKEKVLTYDPDAFSQEKHSLEEIANAMSKAETDHWINQLIALSTILFSLIWGAFWIFLATAIIAVLFDAQFIVVQRFNRPYVLRVINRQRARGLQA